MTMYNPPHPGHFIKETYLKPLGLSVRYVAKSLDVAASTFSRLVSGKSDISPAMALKLYRAFGRSPESWMAMQAEYELWKAEKKINLDSVSVLYCVTP